MCDIPKFPLKRHLSNSTSTRALTSAVLTKRQETRPKSGIASTDVGSRHCNLQYIVHHLWFCIHDDDDDDENDDHDGEGERGDLANSKGCGFNWRRWIQADLDYIRNVENDWKSHCEIVHISSHPRSSTWSISQVWWSVCFSADRLDDSGSDSFSANGNWHVITQPCVRVISLDFSKAFDSVRHVELVRKLSLLNIPDNIFNWMVSFLEDRIHCTNFNGMVSIFAAICASMYYPGVRNRTSGICSQCWRPLAA